MIYINNLHIIGLNGLTSRVPPIFFFFNKRRIILFQTCINIFFDNLNIFKTGLVSEQTRDDWNRGCYLKGEIWRDKFEFTMHATAIYTRAKELDCRIPDENAFSSFLSQFQSSINQSFREVKRFEYWRLILFWSQFYLAINSSLKEK